MSTFTSEQHDAVAQLLKDLLDWAENGEGYQFMDSASGVGECIDRFDLLFQADNPNFNRLRFRETANELR